LRHLKPRFQIPLNPSFSKGGNTAAMMIWPKQAKSFAKDVSDVVCVAACILWERLYGDKKLTRVSVEMLDDWTGNGYAQLDKDLFNACRIWTKVWETFKNNYDWPTGRLMKLMPNSMGRSHFSTGARILKWN
jgi:hypothetical protein